MIAFFRRFLTSWAALALLALVLVAFVVTGVRDPFGGGGGRAGALASVGGSDIVDTEFTKQYQRAVETLRRDNPALTAEAAARQGAVDQLLGQAIGAKALERFAAAQGVAAGDDAVSAEIASVPQFQIGGRFDQRTYEAALAGQRLSDREVRAQLRGDILRRQVLAPVASGAAYPESAALPYARLILEARRGLVGVIRGDALPVAAPTPAQLAAFYGARRAAFTIPERRVFRYAVIDAAALAGQPSEAEIAAAYARDAATYGARETRLLEQAVVQDEGAARRLVAAVRGGQTFAAAAAAVVQLGAADIAVGARDERAFAGASSAAVARAAFALPDGGTTEPVKSDFGWHVVHVAGVTRTGATPLAAARPAIVAALVKERGAARAADMADKLSAAAAKGGATFADLARKFGLTARTTPPVTSTGVDAGNLPLEPGLKPLLSAAFQADPQDPPAVEDLGEGRAALFQVAEVVPPSVPPLAQIAPIARAAYLQVARAEAAKRLADAVAAEVNAGAPLGPALARRGLPAPQPVAMRRVDLLQRGAQVPPPLALLFSVAPGRTAAQSAGAAGAYVVQALEVRPGDVASAPGVLAGIRQQFGQLAANELAEQFAAAAAADVGVKRNEPAIARLRAQLAGLAEPAAAN